MPAVCFNLQTNLVACASSRQEVKLPYLLKIFFSNHIFCCSFHFYCNQSFAVGGLIVTGTNIYGWDVWIQGVEMEKLFISVDLRLLRVLSMKEPCNSSPPSRSPRPHRLLLNPLLCLPRRCSEALVMVGVAACTGLVAWCVATRWEQQKQKFAVGKFCSSSAIWEQPPEQIC